MNISEDERYMYKSSRKFVPTYIIIVLNLAVYGYTSVIGGNPIQTDMNVLTYYGQTNYLVMEGWYWQLFTAMFVHVNLLHLVGNMFFLLIFGLRAEGLFAIHEYLLVYFLSGLAGNLLTLLFGPSMVSAGASGAIFGLFGACTIYIRRALGRSIVSALLFSFFLLIINSGRNVNILAHLGGLIVGLLIGYVLAATRELRTSYRYTYSYP